MAVNRSPCQAPERNHRADTYDDHRMAMSFALAGTKISGITIREVECTRKTYPDFFKDLAKLGTELI